ncbi:hypothetical protein IAI10_00330 [Clostridium sp. 19966]|uniref:hypothetical protein n=1 Tax=Clostridium sp. 19966 TaxID=2768166 RepID=UPI0028DF47B8|nr:hypothetical protein [Clostridium sp. 19966]MDT8715126.1 hypothetical protein [Clostridium sp. 19966]
MEVSVINKSVLVNLFKNLPLSSDDLKKAIIYNSTAVFALIDNLNQINYKFTDFNYTVYRKDIKALYNEDFSSLLKKDEWQNKVQDKLKDAEYVKKSADAVIKNS